MNFSSKVARPATLAALAIPLLAATIIDSSHHRLATVSASLALVMFGLAFALAAAQLHNGDESERVRPLYVPAAILGVAAIEFATRRFSGVPQFAHDWKWPLVHAAFAVWPASLSSLWNDWGSGGPAVQAVANYPITLAGTVLGLLVSPLGALRLTLAIIGAIAGVGAAALAARFRLGPKLGLVAAAVFPLMPPSFNRLNAGHLLWLLSFAVFPWLLAAFHEGSPRRRIALSGLLFGVAALQTQCILFCGLVLATFGSRRALSLALVLAIGLALNAPVLASIYSSHFFAAYASAHATAFWQQSQSSPAMIALTGGADPIHYFERAAGPALAFLPAMTLAALGALTSRRAALLALCWTIAGAWAAGSDGPLGGFLSAFTLSAVGVAFREYSHAEIVATPAMLILVLLGVKALLGASRLGPALAVSALLPILLPAISGVPDLAVSRDAGNLEQISQLVARLPGDGEVLWWPGVQPVSYGSARGGVDPDAFRLGKHAPYTDYRPNPQIIVTLQELQAGDSSGCGLLANLGVQAVVVRKGVFLATALGVQRTPPSEEKLRKAGLLPLSKTRDGVLYSVPCYRGRLTFTPVQQTLFGDWHDLARLESGALRDVLTMPPPAANCKIIPPVFDYIADGDAGALIPLSALDSKYARFGWAFGEVGITRRAWIGASNVNYVLASIGGNPYRWYPRSAVARGAETGVWLWASCSSSPAPRAEVAMPLVHLKTIAATLTDGGLSSEQSILRRGGLAVLHQASYGAWQARTEQGPLPEALQANGFSAAWQIPPGTKKLEVRYKAPDVKLLWLVVALTAAVCIAVLNISNKRKRQE